MQSTCNRTYTYEWCESATECYASLLFWKLCIFTFINLFEHWQL